MAGAAPNVLMFEDLRPGQRVRVIQRIDRREGDWTTAVEGVVRRVELEPTVSWFAGADRGRVWLRRVYLEKAGGEVSVLNVDLYTRLELIEPAAAEAEDEQARR